MLIIHFCVKYPDASMCHLISHYYALLNTTPVVVGANVADVKFATVSRYSLFVAERKQHNHPIRLH